MKIIRRQN